MYTSLWISTNLIKTCSKALGFSGSETERARLAVKFYPILLRCFVCLLVCFAVLCFLSVTKDLHSADNGQRAAVISAHHCVTHGLEEHDPPMTGDISQSQCRDSEYTQASRLTDLQTPSNSSSSPINLSQTHHVYVLWWLVGYSFPPTVIWIFFHHWILKNCTVMW